MPRVLHKLRIDEISAVDKGAGEGCKVVLYKGDDSKSEVNDMADRFVEVCKRLGDGDPTIIVPSERELFEHIQKYATDHRRPGESSAAAFNRFYTANDDDGLALRRAIAATKRAAGFPLPL
jgi:hypothetical protein